MYLPVPAHSRCTSSRKRTPCTQPVAARSPVQKEKFEKNRQQTKMYKKIKMFRPADQVARQNSRHSTHVPISRKEQNVRTAAEKAKEQQHVPSPCTPNVPICTPMYKSPAKTAGRCTSPLPCTRRTLQQAAIPIPRLVPIYHDDDDDDDDHRHYRDCRCHRR